VVVDFSFRHADRRLRNIAALNLNITNKEMEEQFDKYIPYTSEAFLAKPSPAKLFAWSVVGMGLTSKVLERRTNGFILGFCSSRIKPLG
jgi:hypothetical protein